MLRKVSRQRKHAVAFGIVILGMFFPHLVSQDIPATAKSSASLVYDVISIRPVTQDGSKTLTRKAENGELETVAATMTATHDLANGYSASNVSVSDLIAYAYDIHHVDRIKSLPAWAIASSYNVDAKMDDSTIQEFQKLPKEGQCTQRQAMLQALLADRFKLKVHFEEKEISLYEIVVDKGGLKAKPAIPEGRKSTSIGGSGILKDKRMSMDDLASSLSFWVGQTVVNKTGVSGRFDISLSWNPQSDSDPDDPRPSLLTAVRDQLGLRLVPAKGMVRFLMVDHVEKASEN